MPSSMIILNKPVPGYNNVLTTATKEMGFGRNDKINFQGFVKKKKVPRSPKEEKFEHTLTRTENTESEESDEDLTPTNTSPPPLVLPKKSDGPLEEKEKDDHWETLSTTFYMVLATALLGLYMIGK